MGRDSVIECVNEAGAVKAYASWTIVESGKFDAMRTGIVSLIYTNFHKLLNKMII